MAWFGAEHRVLLAAVTFADTTGIDAHAWQLAWTLANYLDRSGHWHDQVNAQRAAVAAVERGADPATRALVHRTLAIAYVRLNRHADAHTHLRHALDRSGRAGDRIGQAHIHHVLATLHAEMGRYAIALDQIQQGPDHPGRPQALRCGQTSRQARPAPPRMMSVPVPEVVSTAIEGRVDSGGGSSTAQQHRALAPPDRGAGLRRQRQPAPAPG
jgi:hypothetical protein